MLISINSSELQKLDKNKKYFLNSDSPIGELYRKDKGNGLPSLLADLADLNVLISRFGEVEEPIYLVNYEERFDEMRRRIPHQFDFISNYRKPEEIIQGSDKVKEYSIEEFLNFQNLPILIGFEGIRGCGKSTQAILLKKELEKYGKKVLTVRPVFTDSIYGETLKKISRDMYLSFEPKSDSLLLMADFVNTVDQMRRADVDVVIFDRWFGSFETVQSMRFKKECGWEEEKIKKYMEACKSFLPRADLCFFFYLPVETALERLNKRKQGMSQKEVEMTYEVSKKYLEIKDEYIQIDAEKSIQDIQKEIFEHVRNKIL